MPDPGHLCWMIALCLGAGALVGIAAEGIEHVRDRREKGGTK